MGNLCYGLWSENRAVRLASGSAPTVTVESGALDAGFPLANLTDLNPGLPIKVSTAPCGLQFDFGSATSIEAVALIHHNFDVGLGVRWQMNATASWGSPTLNQLFTFAADHADGYSKNPLLDIRGISHSFRYGRLLIPSGNSATPYLGEIWLFGTLYELAANIEYPDDQGRRFPGVRHATDGGLLIDYAHGSKIRQLSAMTHPDDAGRTALETLVDDTLGGARPFVLDPLGVTGGDVWMVKFAAFPSAHRFQSVAYGLHGASMDVVELSRGLTVV